MIVSRDISVEPINRSEKQNTCVPVSGTITQHSRCVLFAFLAGIVCFSPHTIADSKLAKVQAVSVVDASINRVFFGRVAARETVDLAFQVGGQIVDFPVTEGEIIPADSMIAKLDLEPYQLSLDQAQAQFSQADRTFKRLNALAVDGVSQTSVDDAETQVQLTRIALSNAERSVRQATLNAPFNAMIATKLVANFSSIAAGTPVVRIHDMSALRIEIDVPELLVQRAGRDPNVEIEAVFPTSEKRYPLELLEFNAETAQVGQTFKVAFTMEPPDDLLVLPGSSARVQVNIKLGEPRVEIPASALVLENDGSASVMLFEPVGAEEGTVRKTGIEIAATSNGAVEVVAGLEAGQEIIVSGAAALDDGAQVTRFGGFEN